MNKASLTSPFDYQKIEGIEILKNLKIGIIAPSCGSTPEVWEKAFVVTGAPPVELNATISEEETKEENLDLGKLAVKFKLLDEMLRSNRSILWAINGGVGVNDVMSMVVKVDYSKESPKIILGYSDITPLLFFFSEKYNWKSVHCATLQRLILGGKEMPTFTTLISYLASDPKTTLKISDLVPLNAYAGSLDNDNVVIGKTTGGNLHLVNLSIGHPWQIEPAVGKIVFLENVNEYPQGTYAKEVDTALCRLEGAGVLREGVKGIIFGEDEKEIVDKVLLSFALRNSEKFPVFKSMSFGHQKLNLPWGYNLLGKILKISQRLYEVVME